MPTSDGTSNHLLHRREGFPFFFFFFFFGFFFLWIYSLNAGPRQLSDTQSYPTTTTTTTTTITTTITTPIATPPSPPSHTPRRAVCASLDRD